MKLHELAERIEQAEPNAEPFDVARLCVLMTNYVGDLETLGEEAFEQKWDEMGLRLQAVTDQHEAIANELKVLSRKPPEEINHDDIWTLMRIIKVQAQVLRMYTAPPEWSAHG